MKRKQDWMHDYLIDNGYAQLTFVGTIREGNDYKENAERIRRDLDLKEDWFQYVNSSAEAFKILRSKMSDTGILVMQNGVALNNTHRSLDVEEFRAFALVDGYAPLIFLNTKDTLHGKIFSLLHEAAHIWLGVNSLYNDISYYNENQYRNDLEIQCNAIAAELLAPENIFHQYWNETAHIPLVYRIKELSDTFKASQIVIARRALDFNKINEKIIAIL